MPQAVELSDAGFEKLLAIATKLQNRDASKVMEACLDAMINKMNTLECEKANEIFAEQAEDSFFHPSSFDGSNAVFGPPVGMSENEVYSLVAARIFYNGQPAVVTCWKPTAEQLEHIKETGRVWVMLMGQSMQPICVSSMNPLLFPWVAVIL